MTPNLVQPSFVGFWMRVLATLIDTSLGWLAFPITFFVTYWAFHYQTIVPYLVFSLFWIFAIQLFMVVFFGGTPGKLIIGARIVDRNYSLLTWGAAIKRSIPSFIIVGVSVMQLRTAATNFGPLAAEPSFLELARIINVYGGVYSSPAKYLSYFVFIDVLTVLLNDKKRAIHDFLAGSVVITKQSWIEMRGRSDGQTWDTNGSPEGPDEASSSESNQSLAVPSEPCVCLLCGATIAAGADQCPACGWSYDVEEDQ